MPSHRLCAGPTAGNMLTFTIGKKVFDTPSANSFSPGRSKMSLLSRLTIRTKLASMVALSALTVCTIIAVSASLSERRMVEDRVAQLRTAVDMMVGMAQTLQDEVAAGKMTLAEAQNQFRLRGRKMTFGKG